MISKSDCLVENKVEIVKKAMDRWFYSADFEISKKVVNSFINNIFAYLSRSDVYVNIFDVNFVELIMKDLNDCIMNFISFFEDYTFMSNFKGSIRHLPNKERDRLMEFAEYYTF